MDFYLHSKCTQLLECVSDWTMVRWSLAIHNSCRANVAFIDFSKASDSVCHSTLICKLESFGIGGKLLSWIKDYLSTRTRRVKVGFLLLSIVYTTWSPNEVSVLCLIYKNDLVSVFGDSLSVKLFADDVKMYVIDNDVKVQVLREGLNKLKNWSDSWQLDLSFHKCAMLHIGNDTKKNSYNGLRCRRRPRAGDRKRANLLAGSLARVVTGPV